MQKALLASVACWAFLAVPAIAQEQWDLKRCVDYAIQNNLTIKQVDVTARTATVTTKLNQWQQYPTLNFSTSGGINSGRSIDPTSNQFTTTQVGFQSYNVQTGITLFNFFSIRNGILSAQTDEQAYHLDVKRAANDISLNVAAAYLQLLLSLEQMNIASTKIGLTRGQLDLTRKLVDAGSMPELNAAQIEAQLATDSSAYISARSTMQLNRLNLLALLNLDAATPLEVSLPDLEKIPLEPLTELQPAALYQSALLTQPSQQVNALHVRAAELAVKANRAAMYPSLTAFASITSNWSSTYRELAGITPNGRVDTLGTIPISGVNYPVTSPGYTTSYTKTGYFRQIGDLNLAQAVGISINVPILRSRTLRSNWERAKLNVESLKLNAAIASQKLQQDIYTAYNNAVTASQNYQANTKAAQFAQYAFDLAKKRYDIGMLSSLDFLNTQNNLNQAKINQASARYDYIFRVKVLEFYKYSAIRI